MCITSILLLAGGMIAAFHNSWAEPRYKGIPLNRWLQRLDSGESTLLFSHSQYGVPWLETLSPERRAAAEAVRAVGVRAIPHLLRMLNTKESRLLTFMHSPSAGNEDPVFSFAHIQKQRALYGLAVLGPAAESSIPDVANALHDPDAARQAALTLAYLGPGGLEVLRRGITGQERRVASVCINSVGINKIVSPEIQAALLERVGVDGSIGKLLAGVDEGLREDALGTLNVAGVGISTQVSCLVATLGSTNQDLRHFAASRLEGLGKCASNSIPALKRTLNDPDSIVRGAVTNALRRISPGVLENLDVQDRVSKGL